MNKKHSSSKEQKSDNINPISDSKLILYNDDVNAFSYVVKCIIEILDCTDQQAEQLTLIAHYKGSVTVKEGPSKLLLQLSSLFKGKGLKSAVQQNDQK